MTDDIPRSRDEIEAELARIENHFDSLEVEMNELYTHKGYLEGLRYALGEFEPEPLEAPAPETVDGVVSQIRDEFPEATVSVKRESSPPNYEDIRVDVKVTIGSIEEYEMYSDRVSEIARSHEDEGELVLTYIDRDRTNENENA